MIRSYHCSAGLLLAAFAVVLLSGCTILKPKVVPPPPAEQARPAPAPKVQTRKDVPIAHYRNRQFYVHQVRWPGESLGLIAQWYTGSRANWKKLYRVTPNLRSHNLYQGNVVFIPLDLLQIETPMPQQYVQQQRPPPAAPAVRSSGDDPQPKPYGPRPYPKKPNS